MASDVVGCARQERDDLLGAAIKRPLHPGQQDNQRVPRLELAGRGDRRRPDVANLEHEGYAHPPGQQHRSKGAERMGRTAYDYVRARKRRKVPTAPDPARRIEHALQPPRAVAGVGETRKPEEPDAVDDFNPRRLHLAKRLVRGAQMTDRGRHEGHVMIACGKPAGEVEVTGAGALARGRGGGIDNPDVHPGPGSSRGRGDLDQVSWSRRDGPL